MLVTQPHHRLSDDQVRLIDGASRDLLQEPGLLCYNQAATEFFRKAGAAVEDAGECARIRIPSTLIDTAVETAPSEIILGAPPSRQPPRPGRF